MKRALACLGFASLLLATVPASAAAAAPVSISIHSASLLAHGAGVQVSFAVTCEPPSAGVDNGSVSVNQRVSRGLVATASGEDWTWGTWATPLTCDGTTANEFTQTLKPDSVAFKPGVALVEVYVFMNGTPNRLTVEMKIK